VIKRVIDVTLACLALLLLLPVFVLVAVWIKLDSPGPVFFRQERVGLHGKRFRIFKFRTMVARQADGELQITAGNDERITRAGRLLRRSKLDELPQLIDVLRGTMSLVGPRPEVPRYVDLYPLHRRERLLSVRPGITDFASLRFKDEAELLSRAADPEQEYRDVILPEKLRVASNYVEHASLTADMRALRLTMRSVLIPERSLQTVRDVMVHQGFWSKLEARLERASTTHRWLAIAADAAMILACWHLTYLFRLGVERWQPGRPWYDDWVSLGVVLAYLLALSLLGARQTLWRYFAFDDARRIFMACALAGIFSAVWILMAQLVGVARAVLVLHPVFTALGLVLMRMMLRMVWEHAHTMAAQAEPQPMREAIVMGAGETARRLLAGLHRRQGWRVVAVLDDSPALQGMRIAGVPVVGPLARIRDPAVTFGATHAIVTFTSAEAAERENALRLASDSGLTVLVVPEASELQPVDPAGQSNAVL
jgi:lipopolysaccharide/colanic/teichoic acid biosynthesis glycosyltransferase